MTRTASSLVAVLLCLTGCRADTVAERGPSVPVEAPSHVASADAGAPTPVVADAGAPASAEAPLVLRLAVVVDGSLHAVLRNASGAPRTFLHDRLLQPSRLELTTEDGTTVEAFDERSRMKFDPTIRCATLQMIAPGALLELADAAPHRTLRWGPYTYTLEGPRTYRARVIWERPAETCVEAEGGTRTIPHADRTTLVSNTVTFDVP